ncbi:glutathione S-transferase [Amorphus suaedae]
MLTFFHSPGSCSDGILVLLHEVGADFTTEIVNVRDGQQHHPDYRARNPKGKVPALLLEDGSVLTEFPAIAYWLATTHPQAGLWPDDPTARARTLEALDFIVASVHMRGFTFAKVPGKFHSDPGVRADLRAYGLGEVEKGLRILSDLLADKPYLAGRFGITDAALFYVSGWAEAEPIEMPDNLAAHLARMRARPSIIAAFP